MDTTVGLRTVSRRGSAGVAPRPVRTAVASARSGAGTGESTAVPAEVSAQVAARVTSLLARSDAHLVAADLASDPGERLVHGHLAALRAGAALVAVRPPRPGRRTGPRSVWDMVREVEPALAGMAAGFAQGAPLRHAIENGRAGAVDEGRADATVAEAEQFQDAVRAVLGPLLDGVRAGRLAGGGGAVRAC